MDHQPSWPVAHLEELEASSGSLALAQSFTLSASGTFVKEDFVINKSGIAAINHTEVRRTGLHLPDLELLEVLGKGASSLVRRAVHKPTQAQLAVKILNVFDKGKRDQLLRELRTLYTSQNFPWLVAFHDCLYDEGAMYIVLEYMDGGSLADVLQVAQLTGSSALSESVMARVSARVLRGLNYLHRERHQVHRDIKPGNILLNTHGEVKISDFGLSAELDSTKEMCATFIGTHAYMSPERLSGKPYSFASDIWSLGITLVECANGEYPYPSLSSANAFVLLSQIINDPAPTLSMDTFSPEFVDFIARCLHKEPEHRPQAHELLQHPWLQLHDDALRPFDFAAFVRTVNELRQPHAAG
jgi:serine/threonine protein kinase